MTSAPSAFSSAATSAGPPVAFENVSVGFAEGDILRGVSFNVQARETLVLLGETGTGKTLTLKMAAGLLKPTRGSVSVLGNRLEAMSEKELLELRRRIGFVFQEGALFDSMTVGENVAFRLREEQTNEDEIQQRVIESLRFVELEHTVDQLPSELSGGMRRRVSIARAIISKPDLILYDSPTGGLDPITSTTIIELIIKQRDVSQTTSLLITHRIQDAFTLATHRYNPATSKMELIPNGGIDPSTKFLVLNDGHIVFDGTTQELTRTTDDWLKAFIS
jgi:phospholipid/cholesterol/gamma-HCH transport system ATP-binding protein